MIEVLLLLLQHFSIVDVDVDVVVYILYELKRWISCYWRERINVTDMWASAHLRFARYWNERTFQIKINMC